MEVAIPFVIETVPQTLVKTSVGLLTGETVNSTHDANSFTCVVNVEKNTQPRGVINTKHSHSNPLYSLGKTPINVSSLLQFLKYYPNTEAAFELSEGFQKGFPLNYQGPRLPTDAKKFA